MSKGNIALVCNTCKTARLLNCDKVKLDFISIGAIPGVAKKYKELDSAFWFHNSSDVSTMLYIAAEWAEHHKGHEGMLCKYSADSIGDFREEYPDKTTSVLTFAEDASCTDVGKKAELISTKYILEMVEVMNRKSNSGTPTADWFIREFGRWFEEAAGHNQTRFFVLVNAMKNYGIMEDKERKIASKK